MRQIPFLTALLLMPAWAFAQEPAQQIPTDEAIPGLMFFTLFAALGIGIAGLIYFLRKRSNRAAMRRTLND
jgi:hypothetical protein